MVGIGVRVGVSVDSGTGGVLGLMRSFQAAWEERIYSGQEVSGDSGSWRDNIVHMTSMLWVSRAKHEMYR